MNKEKEELKEEMIKLLDENNIVLHTTLLNSIIRHCPKGVPNIMSRLVLEIQLQKKDKHL